MSSTPRIAWDNQLTAATWTLSPVESGNADPIGNAADVRPWTFWIPQNSSPVAIADFGSSKTVTAFCLAGHDASGTIGFDTWNGAAWVQFGTATATGDGSTIYVTGTAVSTAKVRFRFPATFTFLAYAFAGEDLICPEGLAPGWSDPVLAQRAKTTPEMSRGGVWLGTAVELWNAQLTLSLKAVTTAWAQTYWQPFLRACSTKPFFLTWNEDEFPNSGCLCTDADFGGSAFAQRGFVDVEVSFNADTGLDRRLTP